jgi:L-asparaginase II
MVAVPGLVAKDGAAGVFAAASADGCSVAFKVADGSNDARTAVVAAALRAMGVDVDTVAPGVAADVAVPVLGHGRPVGELRPEVWTSWTS